ncbi:MAG: cobalt-precorrin 5A hydrolase [Fusobacteriaceae bacterium]|nr:cobalt-precorrin 5A hydrolase [Fusobacteriaceae bacterium]MBN2838134.1 cobalt-precorrin 5A hydrolase [Fusobacteriaceae bacterium]
MNNQAIFCVTENGIEIAKKINEKISSDVFVIEKFNKNFGISFTSLKEIINENFKKYKYLVFIMATGIVTRIIAPHILKKDVDPAVISIDEQGNFVIPLLSGHLGGANNQSKKIANIINSIPVITTATDVSGKIAVDTLAENLNCKLDSLESAKKVTSLILQNKEISIDLPKNIEVNNKNAEGIILITNKINIEITKIIPQNICVGIGCKKGTKVEDLEMFVNEVFNNFNLNIESIKNLNSCWVKQEEEGLLKLSKLINRKINFFSKEEIEKFENLIEEKSDFVKNTIGVYGVSEPCAYLGSNRKGKFLVKKIKKQGMTLSLFEEE